MEENKPEEASPFKKWKLFLAVGLGLGVSLYLIITTFDPSALASVSFSYKLLTGLVLAAVLVIVRDASFVYKLRLSTGNRLSWGKSLQTVIMWEFGACVTPKLSEAAFVLYVLKKSGLSYGRSVAVMMLNSFFDNLVFVSVLTILYAIIGPQLLVLPGCDMLQGGDVIQGKGQQAYVTGINYVRSLADKAWIGYILMLSLCLFLAVAIFILPKSAKTFFYRLSGTRLLRRFGSGLKHLGDEIEITSTEYKGQPLTFWAKMIAASSINWSTRYLLNCTLLWAFSNVAFNLLEAYARQYVLWIFMVIPTTPGSSGVAEVSFMALNCDFMPQKFALAVAIATIWRMYSFYVYILIGMLVYPKWISGVVKESK